MHPHWFKPNFTNIYCPENLPVLSLQQVLLAFDIYGFKVKMTVGIRRRTKEKVQYCITIVQR